MSTENFGERSHDSLASEYAGQLLDVLASPDANESSAFTIAAAGVMLETAAAQMELSSQICGLRSDLSNRFQEAGANKEQSTRIVEHILPDRRGFFAQVAANPQKYGYCLKRFERRKPLRSSVETDEAPTIL